MILTGGLGAPPLGSGAGGVGGAPQNLLCGGLGCAVPQTARAFFFNTHLVTVHVPNPAVAYTQPGFVRLDGAGALVAPSGPLQIASDNPYEGIHFGVEAGYPAFETRWGEDGDPDYALIHPDANDFYNARAAAVVLPSGFFPTSLAETRINALLRALRALTVYTLVRQNDGPMLLELESEAQFNADQIP